MINKDVLQAEYSKLEEKLREIDSLPRLNGTGQHCESIDFDEGDTIYYRTYIAYSGCGSDYFCLAVRWDEINEPIEYFKEKFQKEIEKHEEEKRMNEERKKSAQEQRERETFEKLRQKYGE